MKRVRTVVGAAVAAVGVAVVVVLNSPRTATVAAHAQVPPATTPMTSPPSSTTPTTSTAPPTTATTPTSSSTSSATTATASSVLGANEQFSYGSLTVKVTTSGTQITDVVVTSLHPIDAFSTQLDSQAIPVLRQQVLAAQSAQIQGVSGASYTTQAYVSSLQAALNKLHAK